MSTGTGGTDEAQPREETVQPRHERRRRQTRDRIAQTALALFGERGYDAVTIADIAEAADVAKQTVVNHFPAKEDLLLAWHRPVEADLIEMIDQLPLSTSLPEFLKDELPRLFAHLPQTSQAPDGRDRRTAADRRLAGVVTVMIDETTRLRAAGQSPEQINATLTGTVGRALDILHTGIGNIGGSAAPSE